MKYKIGFVGLGKLGLPCAEAIAKKGHEVRGYDIDRVQSDVVKVDSTLKESVENKRHCICCGSNSARKRI